MMEASDITLLAEEYLSVYREIFLIDPFYSVSIAIGKGDYVSQCVASGEPLTWIVNLNPDRHTEPEDVQFSIIESLLKVLFTDLDSLVDENLQYDRVKNGIVSRLANVFSMVLPSDFSDESEDDWSGEEPEEDE